MEKLRSHVKIGLAVAPASCCAMLLTAALDWYTGMPLHYGVFVAPLAWGGLLFVGVMASRVRGRQRILLSHIGRKEPGASGAVSRRSDRWGRRGRGAIIKSAIFLPREGVRAAGCHEREGVFV